MRVVSVWTKTLVNNRRFCIKIRPNQAKSGRNQAPISAHGRPVGLWVCPWAGMVRPYPAHGHHGPGNGPAGVPMGVLCQCLTGLKGLLGHINYSKVSKNCELSKVRRKEKHGYYKLSQKRSIFLIIVLLLLY